MARFYWRKDWKSLESISCQSSDDYYTEEVFDYEGFNTEQEYFLEYLLNEKRKIENLIGEEVYLVFNLCRGEEAVFPEEIIAQIPFTLESLMAHLDYMVLLDDNNNLLFHYYVVCGYYRDCFYEYNEQLFYVKKSDLINYLYNNEDTSDFFANKLVEFKFNENEFYKLENSHLSKKKEFDISKEKLQYKIDTSVLGENFISELKDNELSISDMFGLSRRNLTEDSYPDGYFSDELEF